MEIAEVSSGHKAATSIRIKPEGSKKSFTVRGNGDNIFKAMALLDDSKVDGLAKKNKLKSGDGSAFPEPSSFANRGRFVMTLSNVLRSTNKKQAVTIGKYTLQPGEANAELDAAFDAAVAAAQADKDAKAEARAEKTKTPVGGSTVLGSKPAKTPAPGEAAAKATKPTRNPKGAPAASTDPAGAPVAAPKAEKPGRANRKA